MGGTRTALGTSAEPLVTAYDCAMLDLDGVVYVGGHAVDGVPEILATARGRGMTLAFVTNNASRRPETVADHLAEIGVRAEAADVVTSAQAAAREVADRVDVGAKVLVIGGEGLVVALQELGLVPVTSAAEMPAAVAQGFDPGVGWRQLTEGAAAIRGGAIWVASNLDLTVPTPRGPAPGNGALVNALAAAVDRRPVVVAGKPFRGLFDETVRRISSRRPIVVGDRLDTDIEGAVRCGADSLLVMTGVTDPAALAAAPAHRRPTYVAWTMRGLLTAHAAPEESSGTWSLGGWVAAVDDGCVSVRRRGDCEDDGLRAVTAAAWAWCDSHPDSCARLPTRLLEVGDGR